MHSNVGGQLAWSTTVSSDVMAGDAPDIATSASTCIQNALKRWWAAGLVYNMEDLQ